MIFPIKFVLSVAIAFTILTAPSEALPQSNQGVSEINNATSNERSKHVKKCSPPDQEQIDNNLKRLVVRILSHTGLPENSLLIRTEPKKYDSDQRFATTEIACGEPVIYFSPAFVDKLRLSDTKNQWGLYGIAAHEVGHHLANHIGARSEGRIGFTGPIRDRELIADFFAGYTLARLGASLEQAEAALDFIELNNGTDAGYPNNTQRLTAVKTGWNRYTSSIRETANPIAAIQPDDEIVIYDNTDIFGYDLGDARIGEDINRCILSCKNDSTCAGISFDKWNNVCFLKSNSLTGSRTFIDSKSILILKKNITLPPAAGEDFITGVWRQFHWEMIGISMAPPPSTASPKKLPPTNFEDCRKACLHQAKCVAMSFHNDREVKCVLLEGAYRKVFNPGVNSGYKAQSTKSSKN